MKQLGWIIAILVVLGGGYWWWQGSQESAMTGNKSADAGALQQTMPVPGSDTPEMVVSPAANTVTVNYDGSAFTPADVTVKKGDSVTFTTTGPAMWVASGPHPQHTGYAGTALKVHCAVGAVLSFDQCAAGTTYTFVFDKVGTWPYHNHVKLGAYGKVTVVE